MLRALALGAAVLPCRHRALDGQEEEAAMLEELLLAALHMYKVRCRHEAAAAGCSFGWAAAALIPRAESFVVVHACTLQG
jgi:hypothetical protein